MIPSASVPGINHEQSLTGKKVLLSNLMKLELILWEN